MTEPSMTEPSMTEPTERDRKMVIALFQSPEGATVGRVVAALAAAREEGKREAVRDCSALAEVADAIAAAREEGRQEALRTIDLDNTGLIITTRNAPEKWREEERKRWIAWLYPPIYFETEELKQEWLDRLLIGPSPIEAAREGGRREERERCAVVALRILSEEGWLGASYQRIGDEILHHSGTEET